MDQSAPHIVPGGWGDINIAGSAVVVLATSPDTRTGGGIYLLWNNIGRVDIRFVISTATRLCLSKTESMKALTKLPLSLLPTLIVPLIPITSVILFARLLRQREANCLRRWFKVGVTVSFAALSMRIAAQPGESVRRGE